VKHSRFLDLSSRDHDQITTSPRTDTHSYSPTHTVNWLLRKYPNPFATHVFSVDTISRTVDPDTGFLRSERLIGIQQGAPKWISKVSNRTAALEDDCAVLGLLDKS
jgi:hypothetical protein